MFNIRIRERTNTWPGFVDLFSNLVIILIFLLIVFVFLWTTTSVFNKNTGLKTVAELKETNATQAEQIQRMTANEQENRRLLIMARKNLGNLETEIQERDLSIGDLISAYESKVTELQSQTQQMQTTIDSLTNQLAKAQLSQEKTSELEQQRRELQSEMDAQRANLSDQLTKLQAALDAAEEKSHQQEIDYIEMSTKLNKALADKVAELNSMSQYQSAFYKAIKDALGNNNSAIEPDGDRFIVSSDILFPSGSYTLSKTGKKQLKVIAEVIKNLEQEIPSDIKWIIRVDGHTDNKRVIPGTRGYKNNMQLSLLRAVSVVNELARNGVARGRLLPSGFGALHPFSNGNTPADLQKNRRIELQLTNR